MGYFNKVILLGNVTRDPELRTLPSDTKVADFGLAANRKYKTQSGEEREETLFIDCAAFGRNAEVIHEYCVKGKPLMVEGHLKFDSWEDKQSGQKRNKISVIVETFQFVGTREGAGSSGGGSGGGGKGGVMKRDPKRAAPEGRSEGRSAPAGREMSRDVKPDESDRKANASFEEDGAYEDEIPF